MHKNIFNIYCLVFKTLGCHRWAAERWRRMKHEEQQEGKRKKKQEEIRKRMEDVDRKAAAEREADR